MILISLVVAEELNGVSAFLEVLRIQNKLLCSICYIRLSDNNLAVLIYNLNIYLARIQIFVLRQSYTNLSFLTNSDGVLL